MHEHRHDVRVQHGLDLFLCAGHDVRDAPAGLLAQGNLLAAQQHLQAWQRAGIDDGLRLLVVARDKVADRAQRGRLDGRLRVRQQLDDALDDAGLEHGREALVVAVGEVRERPQRVRDHFLVLRVDQRRERRQRVAHLAEVRQGLAAAKVRERPGRVADEAERGLRHEQAQQRRERAGVEHDVARRRAVARDVAQRPRRLLAYVLDLGVKQAHKVRHGARSDDGLRVLRCAGGDVRQRPGRLELQPRARIVYQQLRKDRHDAGADDRVDWRRLLCEAGRGEGDRDRGREEMGGGVREKAPLLRRVARPWWGYGGNSLTESSRRICVEASSFSSTPP